MEDLTEKTGVKEIEIHINNVTTKKDKIQKGTERPYEGQCSKGYTARFWFLWDQVFGKGMAYG